LYASTNLFSVFEEKKSCFPHQTEIGFLSAEAAKVHVFCYAIVLAYFPFVSIRIFPHSVRMGATTNLLLLVAL
jgi:hypothetical protein